MEDTKFIKGQNYHLGHKEDVGTFQFIEDGIYYFLPVKGCSYFCKDDKHPDLIGFIGNLNHFIKSE